MTRRSILTAVTGILAALTTKVKSTIDNPLLDNGRFYITVYKKKTVA